MAGKKPLKNRIIQQLPIGDIIPNPRNAKKHSDEQIVQIVSSIREWGWTNPILIDIFAGNIIIAGHGRRLAAMKIWESPNPEIKFPDGTFLEKNCSHLDQTYLYLH